MRYQVIRTLDDVAFRRATGVTRASFAQMLTLLTEAEQERRRRGGRKPKLSVADRLLMALMYLRAYRTTSTSRRPIG